MATEWTYAPAPPAVAALLSKHDTGHHAFLTHVDRSPVAQKKNAFLATALVNAILAAFVIWRLATAATHYRPAPALLAGLPLSPIHSRSAWIWLLANLVLDYQILGVRAPALRAFIAGELLWRLRHGFRAAEPIVRAPTGPHRAALARLPPAAFVRAFTRALHAAADARLLARAGADTGTGVWAVDFRATRAAAALLARGAEVQAFEVSAWRFDPDARVWGVYEFWRARDAGENARQTRILQARLEAMGRGEVFGEFAAMVEWEGDALEPEKMMEWFEREGVDSRKLWADVWNEAQAERT